MKKNKSALSNYQKFPILILLVSLVMSIGYATISSITLDLEGEVIAKENEGVFITEINCQNSNGATTHSYSAYESNFKSSISLSNSENTSKVICEIIMYNPAVDDYYYFGEEYLVGEETYSNTNITYTLSGIEKGYLLQAKNYVTFTITFHYLNDVIATNNNLKSMINFIFEIKELNTLVLMHNDVIKTAPTLTNSSNNTSDKSGLYSSNLTTNGEVTYYFRGNVTNNNVDFAGLKWTIIRVNEDQTVRLFLESKAGGKSIKYSDTYNSYKNMYYSNGSNAKTLVDDWYSTTIANTEYDSVVETGTFCEQAKVKYQSSWTSGNATMTIRTKYQPNFDCDTDSNGKGVLKLKAGLITCDELIFAGGYYGFDSENEEYYITNASLGTWTMSPAGVGDDDSGSRVWRVFNAGDVNAGTFLKTAAIRPVINIKASALATGTGTITDPYKIILR